MKRILFILLILVASFVCSCNKQQEDKGFEHIELSQTLVGFGQEGGKVTVESNIPVGICDIYCVDTERHYYSEEGISTSLEADGIKAEMEGSDSKTITITVAPSAEKNDWEICVGYLAVSTVIKVKQN